MNMLTPIPTLFISYTLDGNKDDIRSHVTTQMNEFKAKIELRRQHYGHVVRVVNVEKHDV